MTDLGPMQPDYRRRMEAAEAELDELREGCANRRVGIEPCPTHPVADHEKALRDLWREVAEKGIDQGVDWPRIVLTLFDDIATAEAREQALRDRVTGAWDEGYSTCLGDFDIAARAEARSPNPYRNALSPPTADTEESDR